jgi:hypothetical protein
MGLSALGLRLMEGSVCGCRVEEELVGMEVAIKAGF